MPDLFQDNKKCSVEVLVTAPVDKLYSYAVPDGMEMPVPGSYVTVPLGSRHITGVVWSREQPSNIKKIKNIVQIAPVPPLSDSMRAFIDRMAAYTLSPKGSVLKMVLSVPKALEPLPTKTYYKLSAQGARRKQKNATPFQKIKATLQNQRLLKLTELSQKAGVSPSSIKTALKNGLLATEDLEEQPPCQNPDPAFNPLALSDAQKTAAQKLTNKVAEQNYSVTLLDGVTGSGKTEVYFEAVAQAIKQDQQVLILMPEIALSNAFIKRFEDRFGCAPALWHSSVTSAKKNLIWRGVAEAKVKVVIGARSALFLPFADPGLTIIDESHDPSYKQEEGVLYHARDMAILRASLEKTPVILATATPSLETIQNVEAGKYDRLILPERHGQVKMPQIHLVDMRKDKPARASFLSPVLIDALKTTLLQKKQSLLFLNRRGYAPLTLCRACGHRFECPRCTAWLVEHRAKNKFNCHHCGYEGPVPNACPSCGETESLVPCGPGVERIEEEVKALFPHARIAVLSSDTAGEAQDLQKSLENIREHNIDIVIGTQILAKGHHFPKLATVGVVDADLGLHGGDLRAAERSYQVLHQVSGRAGRAHDVEGHVYLQSYNPEAKVMKALASGDRDAFLHAERQERKMAEMPPFARLVAVIISATDESLVMGFSKLMARTAPNADGLVTYGPAQAPIYRIRGRYRCRFLIQADKKLHVQKVVADWIGHLKIPAAIKIQSDIDPQSFL